MTSPDQTPPGPEEGRPTTDTDPLASPVAEPDAPRLDGSELPEGYHRPAPQESRVGDADYVWDSTGSDDATTPLPTFGSEAPTREMPPAPAGYPGSPVPWSAASADAPPAPSAYPTASAEVPPGPSGQPGSPAAFSPAPGPQQSTAAAPSVDLAALGAKATSLGIPNPLPALAVAGATWVGGLVAAVITLVLLSIVGAVLGGGGMSSSPLPSELEDVSAGAGTLFAAPFQLLALAGLGSFGARMEVPLIGNASLSLRFIPLLATLALVLLPYFGARLVVRRRGPARILGIAVEALLAGFVVALLVTLGALIFAASVPLEDMVTLRLHAAGADSFFGTWLIVGVAYAIGQILASRGPSRHGRFTDLLAGVRLAILHAVVFSAVVFAGMWIWAIIQSIREGDGVMLAIVGLPLLALAFLGQFIASACGLGMLGSLGASGGLGSFGLGGTGVGATQYASIFSAPWWVWLLVLLAGLVVLVLMSAIWGAGRTIVPGDLTAKIISWAALPAVYFAGAIALAILAHVGFTASAEGEGTVGGSLGLAPWVPFLALLVGGAVEGLSRLVSPLVGGMVPAVAERLVRGRADAAAPVSGAPSVLSPTGAASSAALTGAAAPAAMQTGSADAQTGSAASASGPAPAAAPVPLGGASQREPMTKEAKRRLLLILGLLGAAVALVIAAIVAIVVMSSTIFSPKHEVESYLDAVTAGDYGTAAQIAQPNAPNANRVLLTDGVGAKTEKRITSYTIDDVEVSEDTAIVTATLDQDGQRTQRTFTVDRAGNRFLVFPEWKLGEVEYTSLSFYVPQGVEKVTVNGVEVEVAKLETTSDEMGYAVAALPVLPGTYAFSGPSLGEYIEAEPVSTTVAADGAVADSSGGYVYLNYIINDAGEKKVQEDVNAKIDECAATGQPSPDGCPLGTYSYNDTAGTWSVTSYPVVTLEQGDEGAFYLQTETDGAATFTYTYDSFGTPTPMTMEDSISVTGTVTYDDKGELVIEYSDY
ncbi:hypothetical protein [Brachybacterium nesterenkovii]|uniref:hypothetical protein n=1 Tax=Brachybacterium nesterenkovii TaxID=47847 RepID=UPI00321AA9C1